MVSELTRRTRSQIMKGIEEKAEVARHVVVEAKEIAEGQKFIVPNYTVKQLLDVIPAHCFHRSGFRSSLYVLQDVAVLAACAYCALHMDSLLLNKLNISDVALTAVRVILWTGYTFAAGLFGTGLWVIGHECGHQAFSSSKTVNNVMGWILHSALLVPYHAWRISPKEEAEILGVNVSAMRQRELREAIEESPLATLIDVTMQQLLGFPAYLILNTSGQRHYSKGTSHFNPDSVIFKPQHKWQILASNLGVLLNLATLAFWAHKRSFAEVLVMYLIPYLWVNHWLVFITYLQHTDPHLPHYSANKWTFARGALCTIDRNFMGPIGPYVFHGICETHVAHHISSKIPHYNAWEATKALKTFLGPHYISSTENMFTSFWKSNRECIFVEEDEDIVFYKNYAGVAKFAPVEEDESSERRASVSDSGIEMIEPKERLC